MTSHTPTRTSASSERASAATIVRRTGEGGPRSNRLEQGPSDSQAALSSASGERRVGLVVADVAVGQVQERPQPAHRQGRVRRKPRPPRSGAKRLALAGEDPLGHSIAQPVERLVDPPRGFGAAEREQVREDVVLEKARVEVAQDRQRSAARDRPGTPVGPVFLGRDCVERVDRPARGGEHFAREAVRLLGAVGREGVEGASDLGAHGLVVTGSALEVPGHLEREGLGSVVLAALHAPGEQRQRPSRRLLDHRRLAELDSEVDRRLADVAARLGEDEVEQLHRGLGLGLGRARETPQERGRRAGIAVEEPLRDRAVCELDARARARRPPGPRSTPLRAATRWAIASARARPRSPWRATGAHGASRPRATAT